MMILLVILIILILSSMSLLIMKIKNKRIENIKNIGNMVKEKQKIYTDILKRTKKALDRLNIPFFLSSGTCLGYFRENKFIDHDYDIDIGIWREDYDKRLIKEMEKENLKLYRIWGDEKTGMELSFILPNTVLGKHAKIDIFLHYKGLDEHGKSTVSWYTYAPKKSKRIQYRVSDFSIQRTNFMGVDLYVPYPTLKYIEEHYGNDWIIPKKPKQGYSYWSSPKSIVN